MKKHKHGAARQLLAAFIKERGGELRSMSFTEEGVLVRLVKPFGKYGQTKVFYSWGTVADLQTKALNGVAGG